MIAGLVMSDAALWVWLIYLIVVLVVIVPIVLLLLGNLIRIATNISKHGSVAEGSARQIRANTDPAPQLTETLQIVRDILDVARTVERHGADLERVLVRPMPEGGRR